MTEKFSTAMYMDRGAEQLVEILNHYISAIVESECPRALVRTPSAPRPSVCVGDDPGGTAAQPCHRPPEPLHTARCARRSVPLTDTRYPRERLPCIG